MLRFETPVSVFWMVAAKRHGVSWIKKRLDRSLMPLLRRWHCLLAASRVRAEGAKVSRKSTLR